MTARIKLQLDGRYLRYKARRSQLQSRKPADGVHTILYGVFVTSAMRLFSLVVVLASSTVARALPVPDAPSSSPPEEQIDPTVNIAQNMLAMTGIGGLIALEGFRGARPRSRYIEPWVEAAEKLKQQRRQKRQRLEAVLAKQMEIDADEADCIAVSRDLMFCFRDISPVTIAGLATNQRSERRAE